MSGDGFIQRSTYKTETSPNEEHTRLEVRISWALIHHVGCGVGNGEVKKPVGGGGHGEAFGTDFEWEQFSGYDPCDWTP
jgi:hypothetical protein